MGGPAICHEMRPRRALQGSRGLSRALACLMDPYPLKWDVLKKVGPYGDLKGTHRT